MYSSFMSWSRHFSYEHAAWTKKIFQGSRMMNDASHWLPCVKVTFLWIITLNPYPKIHFLSSRYVKEEEMNCLSSQKIKAFAWHFHTLHFFQRLFSFLQLLFPIYIRDSHLPIIAWCSCSSRIYFKAPFRQFFRRHTSTSWHCRSSISSSKSLMICHTA